MGVAPVTVRYLDATGTPCAVPAFVGDETIIAALRRVLASLPQGATVALVATDPAAVLDVPHFCAEGGHELLSSEPLPDGARRYLVRRG